MSFFKDLREDIAQSVSELSETFDEGNEEFLKKDVVSEEAAAPQFDTSELADLAAMYDAMKSETEDAMHEETGSTSMEKTNFPEMENAGTKEPGYGDITTGQVGMEVDETARKDAEEIPAETIIEQKESKEDIAMNEDVLNEMSVEDQTEEQAEEVVMPEGEESSSEEITVITQGTIISGSIKSDTSLLVKGTIDGDVECDGKLTIEGSVSGNTIAKEIYVNTPRLAGDINSRGIVKIDVGTVVFGNVTCTSVVLAGAVKGDIDVNGPVIIDSTAVVKGNVRAKSIQINSGAVIDGTYSLAYADVDIEKLFEQ